MKNTATKAAEIRAYLARSRARAFEVEEIKLRLAAKYDARFAFDRPITSSATYGRRVETEWARGTK